MNWTWFTDRDLGKAFPNRLLAEGLSVERLDNHFPQNCPDEVWLEEVGARGWVVLTHDGRIRYKPNEKAAVIRHRVRMLVIVGKVPMSELAENFVRTLGQVEAFLKDREPPFIGRVYRAEPKRLERNPLAPGRVELWFP